MTDYLFHIGAGKTGSSSIQKFLKLNHDILRQNNYIVPGANLDLSSKITGEHVWGVQQLIKSSSDTDVIVKSFDDLDKSVPSESKILISAENLSNLGNARYFKNACQGRNCKALIYIRRQDEFLTSAWQQWHSKMEKDLNAWLIKALRQYGHWDKVIEQWQDIVGKENVIVRVFDRKDLYGEDLLADYCHCLNIETSNSAIRLDIGIENVSYTDVITDLLTGMHGIFEGAHDNNFYNMVEKYTGHDFSPRRKISLISRDTRESILFFYRDINQRVCKNYFPGRRELFPPVDHSKYEYLSTSDLHKQQLQFLTRMIFEIAKRQSH